MARLVLLAIMLLVPPGLSAAGSWTGQAGPVRAVMVDRGMESTPMRPPPGVTAGVMHEVRWRFGVPAGQAVVAWLCHQDGCVPLDSRSGITQALSGVPAATPLHFRFALAPGQRRAVQVSDLQVIVNYR
ncbi:flagellar protein FlhE [Halomonas mongoliensis]|uniref:Flagellar protein FlhE n=1 Tax=Halomonas mongoliensis TaxID=321265 RepID=A0ABU1GP55_9GAMM|nr:flagellar protein FlhE [Halomonas mongoliensis]MDR5893307.1 flagellar protein FlhE [Halomonas mongoliensis]